MSNHIIIMLLHDLLLCLHAEIIIVNLSEMVTMKKHEV